MGHTSNVSLQPRALCYRGSPGTVPTSRPRQRGHVQGGAGAGGAGLSPVWQEKPRAWSGCGATASPVLRQSPAARELCWGCCRAALQTPLLSPALPSPPPTTSEHLQNRMRGNRCSSRTGPYGNTPPCFKPRELPRQEPREGLPGQVITPTILPAGICQKQRNVHLPLAPHPPKGVTPTCG